MSPEHAARAPTHPVCEGGFPSYHSALRRNQRDVAQEVTQPPCTANLDLESQAADATLQSDFPSHQGLESLTEDLKAELRNLPRPLVGFLTSRARWRRWRSERRMHLAQAPVAVPGLTVPTFLPTSHLAPENLPPSAHQ